MKLKSSLILLSLAVIASSCSKNQYAQVEPDDLYFTHKDRKEAAGEILIPSTPTITSVEPAETPTEYERSDYSNNHSPVFTTPSYGSPTIQQYGQKPYYDTSVNPDYLYDEEYSDLEGSNEYYSEDYAYQAPPAYETPQVNNYYYGLPSNYYAPTSGWVGSSFYTSYRPYTTASYFSYDPYGMYGYGPSYGWGYPSYGYMGGYDPYYNSWGNPYCGYTTTIFGGGYGNYSSVSNYYNSDGIYSDGTKIVTKPRQSRSQTSYEVDKSNLPIKSRRADYIPATNKESGRVATNNTGGRQTNTGTNANSTTYTRRGNSTTIYSSNSPKESSQYGKRSNSSATIQDKNRSGQNGQQRSRTVIVPTRTKTRYATGGNERQERNSRSYDANRSSVNSNSSGNRTSGTTRYSTRTTNANRSSYSRNTGSRSNSSYGTRTRSSTNRSSGSRTSYSSGRSSSGSTYKSSGRSSGSSSRSYTPSRSSSGSSGTKSSGRTSSGRSSSRKN